MKYLLISIILLTLTSACCKKQVKKDTKNVKKEVVKEVKETKEKIEPIKVTKKATLSNCTISIEKTFLWMNKMPMVGPKPDFTPLRLATIVRFDNTNGKEALKVDREVFVRSKDGKVPVTLISIKEKEQWNGNINPGEVLEIEFKGDNIDSRKVKGDPSIIFNFIDQDKNSVTVESDPTRINIAY